MSSLLQLPIARPPWTKLGRHLESLTRKAIYTYQMTPSEGVFKLAIALSGGKDSLALLFLLSAISNRGMATFELCAIHVHGAYSCGAGVSLGYLRAICEELRVTFIVKESTQKLETLECYSCSRERRKLLFDAAREWGAETVAFGHHRDDNVQTLMMNMLHKATPAGMLPKVPMHRYGVTIIRPLILCNEADIIEFANQSGFRRITCQCPVGQNSKRRQVELLLEQIEREFPNTRENLSRISLEWGDQSALSI